MLCAHRVGSCWCTQSQLIKGQTFTSGLQDTGTGSLGKAQSNNLQSWHLVHPGVISDGTNEHGKLVFLMKIDIRRKLAGEPSLTKLSSIQKSHDIPRNS